MACVYWCADAMVLSPPPFFKIWCVNPPPNTESATRFGRVPPRPRDQLSDCLSIPADPARVGELASAVLQYQRKRPPQEYVIRRTAATHGTRALSSKAQGSVLKACNLNGRK